MDEFADSVTFRPSLIALFLARSVPAQVVVLMLFGGAAFYQYAVNDATPKSLFLENMAYSCLFVGVVTGAATVANRRSSRVRFTRYGIEAPGTGGTRWLVGWHRIRSVAIVQFCGWRRLKLTSDAEEAIWLPWHVANRDEYLEAAGYFAGDDHPLTRALWNGVN